MRNEKTINFDMDGTIADFYNVLGWLDDIRRYSTRPYEVARPMIHPTWLTRQLNELQSCGWRLQVISWSSKDSTPEFDEAVRIAKVEWLARNYPGIHWDAVKVVPYGTPKHELGSGILFDDDTKVRKGWSAVPGNLAFDEDDIFIILKSLVI